jgi:hypothetical protein
MIEAGDGMASDRTMSAFASIKQGLVEATAHSRGVRAGVVAFRPQMDVSELETQSTPRKTDRTRRADHRAGDLCDRPIALNLFATDGVHAMHQPALKQNCFTTAAGQTMSHPSTCACRRPTKQTPRRTPWSSPASP